MDKKIRYKPISKDLEKMVKPNEASSARVGVGSDSGVGEFFYISVEELTPFHNQARIVFDDKEIASLAESIKENGIRQPLTVLADGRKYEVISGERRLRAAKLAGLAKVPCILVEDSSKIDSIALVENIHRKDLHPVELGMAYKNLLTKGIFKNQAELSEKIAVSKGQISEYLKYADLEEEAQKYIIEHNIESRDKLREVLKAHSLNDKERIRKILGIDKSKIHRGNFSILRVNFNGGAIEAQEKGIKKLTELERYDFKKYLNRLLSIL